MEVALPLHRDAAVEHVSLPGSYSDGTGIFMGDRTLPHRAGTRDPIGAVDAVTQPKNRISKPSK
jgi:hypothetical protein